VKQNIHPKTFETAIVCSTCGTSWPTHSTRQHMRVDICSHCHPFYTGEQRIVDTAGQVDRFMRRLQTAQQKQAVAAERRQPKAEAPKKRSLYQEVFGEDEQQPAAEE